MLIEVIKDIIHFIFILTCVYVAFGHSFLLLSRNNSEGPLLPNMFRSIFASYIIADMYGDIFGDY
jgi:hypothetical protein